MEVDTIESSSNAIVKTSDSEYDQAVRLYKTGNVR